MSEPHAQGELAVGDGHRIRWEVHGAVGGRPAVYFHGGPGGGFTRGVPEMFDLSTWRVVLFDQRGCGRSRPLAEEEGTDLSTNTTHHLIADAEALRTHLGLERWAVLGLSWGSTLGLAYAQRHTDRVTGLVLGSVTTTSRREVEWITEGVGRIFPLEWERFVGAVPAHLSHLRPVDAYARWLFDPDPAARAIAARAWCDWEDAHVSLAPGHRPHPAFDDGAFRLRFARLVTHYWSNHAFLDDDQLVRDASRLDGIPGVLVHGRFDVSSPLDTAVALDRAWATSRLVIVDDAGHGGGGFGEAIAQAIDTVSRG